MDYGWKNRKLKKCSTYFCFTSVCVCVLQLTYADRETVWRGPTAPPTCRRYTPWVREKAATPGLQCWGNNSEVFPVKRIQTHEHYSYTNSLKLWKCFEVFFSPHHFLWFEFTLVLEKKDRRQSIKMSLSLGFSAGFGRLFHSRTSFIKPLPRRTILAKRIASWERWGPR